METSCSDAQKFFRAEDIGSIERRVAQHHGFSLSISPASISLGRNGGTASYTVAINRTGGFSNAVTLSISALPAGASATFNPNPATANSSALTITVARSTAKGSYPFTVTGVGGSPSLTRTANATLQKTR